MIARVLTNSVVRRLALFGIMLSWCFALLLARFTRSGSLNFQFLVWNLFLAAIPVVAGMLFTKASERRSPAPVQATWFALWLVFLPNAPYLITDFVHLQERPPIPLWYDIALLASCAGTGLLFGYSSLADVQSTITRKFSPFFGWTLAFVALFLSAFGIYLGRFLRWNSWDALTSPGHLLFDIGDRFISPFSHPRTVVVTMVYGVVLFLGYLALHVLPPFTPGARENKE